MDEYGPANVLRTFKLDGVVVRGNIAGDLLITSVRSDDQTEPDRTCIRLTPQSIEALAAALAGLAQQIAELSRAPDRPTKH